MTDEFLRKHRPPYSGRVIDGPFEGEWIESETPHFIGHFQQPISALYTGWPAGFEIDRALYRWLSSYRAWVWMQPHKLPDYPVGKTHTGRIADALAFSGDQFGGFKP